jgi:putative YphP/YqiW family bacilliredoxin
VALFRDSKLVHMMQRSDIEHRDAADLASELKRVFDQHCVVAAKQ